MISKKHYNVNKLKFFKLEDLQIYSRNAGETNFRNYKRSLQKQLCVREKVKKTKATGLRQLINYKQTMLSTAKIQQDIHKLDLALFEYTV